MESLQSFYEVMVNHEVEGRGGMAGGDWLGKGLNRGPRRPTRPARGSIEDGDWSMVEYSMEYSGTEVE
jgi:hypothetical protein